ncbi:MAG TPA: type 3 dihydrofolate reductase [Candidatus Tenderia electrophaga]|uniref:Dihydrofolate reductase n=1 Tax=Candidatus Tenderia electrophaga TaxID=1748243 RepID=A0A832J4A5_9GAMM|nr:type 3 dihydrofolate reductase [Candidatus Tenderia electrophaga]
MKISIIAAMADNRVIGINNQLPWNLPADMKWFRQQTMGKPVLMGRKTYDSIGRPLPKRRNIVISRDESLKIEGCEVVNSTDAAFLLCADEKEIMIIGGASFYEQTLPQTNRLYLTLVHSEIIEGDAWFPKIDFNQWRETERIDHTADEVNAFDYSFLILERI